MKNFGQIYVNSLNYCVLHKDFIPVLISQTSLKRTKQNIKTEYSFTIKYVLYDLRFVDCNLCIAGINQ